MTDVLLVDHADGVVTLTLNRPESLNSLNVELKVALREAIEAAGVRPDRAGRSCSPGPGGPSASART